MASSQFHPQLLSPPGPAVRILIHSGRFSASQLRLVTILSALTFRVFFRVGEWGCICNHRLAQMLCSFSVSSLSAFMELCEC